MELNPQKRLNCKEALSHPWYVLSSMYHSIIHLSTSLLYLCICSSCESIYLPMHAIILSIYWLLHLSINSSIHLSLYSSIHLYFSHRISADVARDVNIHESVSAQMKKGAAKAKWKVNISLLFDNIINISRYITCLTIISLYIKFVYNIIVIINTWL